jgi:hypothetical protein
MSPIAELNARELVARTPQPALVDMMEWGPAKTPEEQYGLLVSREFSPRRLMAGAPKAPALQDDRPINEYYWLRARHPELMKLLQ